MPAAPREIRISLIDVSLGSAARWGLIIAACLAVVQTIGVALLWIVLLTTGVFGAWDAGFTSATGGASHVAAVVNLPVTLLVTIVVGSIETVVGAGIAVCLALVFRLASRLTGGLLLGWRDDAGSRASRIV